MNFYVVEQVSAPKVTPDTASTRKSGWFH